MFTYNLVAADIIETAALVYSLQSVVLIVLLVFVGTFLSWSMVLEAEGRWAWQARLAESEEGEG